MKDLKNKIYSPVYLLMGDEPYYIDKVSDFIAAHVLTDAEKTFNQLVMYGKDTDVPSLINNARRFPMMANSQVLILKEAQEMKKIEELSIYIDKPQQSTILVINYKYGSLDKRTKLYKLIAEKGTVLESNKLYENQVPDWISSHLAEKGYSIDAGAAVILTEYLGSDLSKIAHELDKLMLILPKGTSVVNSAIIEKNIGISKDYNNFELSKALSQKNVLKANRIVGYFAKNPKASPLVVTVQIIFNFFTKLLTYHYLSDKSRNTAAAALGIKPFFLSEYEQASKKYSAGKVVEIISLLREYDLKSKGVDNISTSDGELLRELIFRIMH